MSVEPTAGAAETLAASLASAMGTVSGLTGVYDGPPLHAAFPYGLVEIGPETDWSYKDGLGREMRVAVVLRDKGERPTRLRSLIRLCEEAVGGIGRTQGEWRLVTLQFLRSRMLREPGGLWAGTIEFRARMLAEPAEGDAA